MYTELLAYTLAPGVETFSTRRDSVLPYPVIQGHQVHDCKVAVVDRPDLTREDLEGYDALVTALPGVAVGVRTADCVPVLLYDPAKRVVAAVHAGWRGTVLHIPEKAIGVMSQAFGTRARDLRAVVGPSIGPESFQVGEEVAEHFKQADFPMDEVWSFRGEGGRLADVWRTPYRPLESQPLAPGALRRASRAYPGRPDRHLHRPLLFLGTPGRGPLRKDHQFNQASLMQRARSWANRGEG